MLRMIIIISAMILLSGGNGILLAGLMEIPYEIAFMVMVGLHFCLFTGKALNVYGADAGHRTAKNLCRSKTEALYAIMLRLFPEQSTGPNKWPAMEARAFRLTERTYMRKLRLKS